MNYRIKIEELNNGGKRYIPQICQLEITRGLNQKQRLVWYNIIPFSSGVMGLDISSYASYDTEEDALKAIEDHRNENIIIEGNKVKSVTYKLIS